MKLRLKPPNQQKEKLLVAFMNHEKVMRRETVSLVDSTVNTDSFSPRRLSKKSFPFNIRLSYEEINKKIEAEIETSFLKHFEDKLKAESQSTCFTVRIMI